MDGELGDKLDALVAHHRLQPPILCSCVNSKGQRLFLFVLGGVGEDEQGCEVDLDEWAVAPGAIRFVMEDRNGFTVVVRLLLRTAQ